MDWKMIDSKHRSKILMILAASGTVGLLIIVKKQRNQSRGRSNSPYRSSPSPTTTESHSYSSPDPPRKHVVSRGVSDHSSWSLRSLYQRNRPSRGQRAKELMKRVRHRCYIHRLDIVFLAGLIALCVYAYGGFSEKKDQYSYNPFYYQEQSDSWFS